MELHQNLSRLLSPATIAVVGANEDLGMSNNAVRPMLAAGRTVHLVNPRRDTLYGQPVAPTLTDIGEPIDAVLALVNAERSVDLVEEAAGLGCGGVVVAAAGFNEAGAEGEALQGRLTAVAAEAGLAVIGPNCAGFKNVGLGVNLFTGGWLELQTGGVSVVSQSGFLARAALAAAGDRGLGVSIAVSSGNEAVCDLADHVRVLAADPETRVICLVVEAVRRPDAFFAAVAEARSAGKAVLALKLGRGDRARRIMASHTAAIADESWVYDVAFAEHGVISVRDLDHLLDAAQLFAQIPEIGRPIERIGVITTSGGVAALAADLAEELDAPLPTLDELEPWVRERVPGDTVNPLDLTGFVMTRRDLTEELFERYADSVDLLMLAWWLGVDDESWATVLLDPFAAVAERHEGRFLVSPVEATSLGGWVTGWQSRTLLTGRGIESVYRAVDAWNRHLASPVPDRSVASEVTPSERPTTVASEIGPIVGFADAMALLEEAGVVVAPYLVIAPDEAVDPAAVVGLGERLVVKLADVAHRTELGAVQVGVPADEVGAAVETLRGIAARHGVSASVAVQAMVTGHGEAFAGLQCGTALGPVVLFGRGGTLVETGGSVRGRMLPLDPARTAALVDEAAGASVFAGLRGQLAWDTEPLEAVLSALDDLWQSNRSWLESLDVNPLIITPDGPMAVDALFVARTQGDPS